MASVSHHEPHLPDFLSSCLSGHFFLGSFAGSSSSAHPVNLTFIRDSVLDLLLFTLLGKSFPGSFNDHLYAEDPYLQPRPFSPASAPNIQLFPQHLNPCGSLKGTLEQNVQERTDDPPITSSFYCVSCLKKIALLIHPSS